MINREAPLVAIAPRDCGQAVAMAVFFYVDLDCLFVDEIIGFKKPSSRFSIGFGGGSFYFHPDPLAGKDIALKCAHYAGDDQTPMIIFGRQISIAIIKQNDAFHFIIIYL